MEIWLGVVLISLLMMRGIVGGTKMYLNRVALRGIGTCISCRSFGRAGGDEPSCVKTCWHCESVWFFKNGDRAEWAERETCEHYDQKRDRSI